MIFPKPGIRLFTSAICYPFAAHFLPARFVDMTLDLGIAPLKAEELKEEEVRDLERKRKS